MDREKSWLWARGGLVWTGAMLVFSLQFVGLVFHFWLQMALGISLLCLLAYILDPRVLREAFRGRPRRAALMGALGIPAAAGLYCIFYAGYRFVAWAFQGNEAGIAQVYALKEGADVRLIAVLLLVVIGPGEETLWRGYLQRRLTGLLGPAGVVVAVIAYGAVHVASGNPLLVLAALVCGAYWGLLYYRFESLWLNAVSHAVWDIAIFLVWPLS